MKKFSQFVYYLLRFPIAFVFRCAHPIVRCIHKENLPEGPAILCGNHSAFSDPVWIILSIWQKRIPHTMAKKELFSIPVLAPVIRKLGAFPVDRNANDVNAVKTAMHVLKEGDKLIIFPEGTRVKEGKTIVPHAGAVMIAARCQVPVVPVYITKNKKFFHPINVIIGKPFPVMENRKPTPEVQHAETARLMEAIYKLGEEE